MKKNRAEIIGRVQASKSNNPANMMVGGFILLLVVIAILLGIMAGANAKVKRGSFTSSGQYVMDYQKNDYKSFPRQNNFGYGNTSNARDYRYHSGYDY